MRNNRVLQIIVVTLGIVLSFVLVILTKSISIENDKIIFDYDWTEIQKPTFWLLTASVTICTTFAYLGFYSLSRDKLIHSDEFQKTVDTYNDKLKLKADNFDEYIRLNNLEEKTRRYKEKYKAKLHHYEYKLATIPNSKLQSRKAIRYKNKISILSNMLEEEFIKNNIIGARVKYTEIYATNFRYGNKIEESAKQIDKREPKRMTIEYATKKMYKIANKKKSKPMYIIGDSMKWAYFANRIFPLKWILGFTGKYF